MEDIVKTNEWKISAHFQHYSAWITVKQIVRSYGSLTNIHRIMWWATNWAKTTTTATTKNESRTQKSHYFWANVEVCVGIGLTNQNVPGHQNFFITKSHGSRINYGLWLLIAVRICTTTVFHNCQKNNQRIYVVVVICIRYSCHQEDDSSEKVGFAHVSNDATKQ